MSLAPSALTANSPSLPPARTWPSRCRSGLPHRTAQATLAGHGLVQGGVASVARHSLEAGVAEVKAHRHGEPGSGHGHSDFDATGATAASAVAASAVSSGLASRWDGWEVKAVLATVMGVPRGVKQRGGRVKARRKKLS